MPIDANLDLPPQAIAILLGLIGLVLLGIAVAWAVAVERWMRGAPLIPERKGAPVPWSGVQVVVCFFVWQAGTLLAASLLRWRRGPDAEPDLIGAIGVVGAINLLVLFLLPAMLALWNEARAIDFGLTRDWRRIGRDVGLGVLLAIFALPLVYGVQFLAILIWPPTAHPMQEMLFSQRSAPVMALAFVTAVLLAPAVEELLFRGILQGWLEKRFGVTRRAVDEDVGPIEDAPPPLDPRAGERIALIVPAAVFALAHFGQWPAPIPLFVLAIGLGLLYRRTKSIIAPIAAHATFNGLSTVLMIVLVLYMPEADPEVIPGPAEPPAAGVEVELDDLLVHPPGQAARPEG